MNFYHRPHRLLLDAQAGSAPPGDGGRSLGGFGRGVNFDTNMVIILAALLCALVCALGINSIVKFVLRCIRRTNSDRPDEMQPRCGGNGLRKSLLRRIPVAVYGSGAAVAFTDCAICLAEFLDGEKIRILPKCHHCFHVRCVDVWLASHSSCPTCRQSLAEWAVAEAAVGQGGGAGYSDAPPCKASKNSYEEVQACQPYVLVKTKPRLQCHSALNCLNLKKS